MKTLKNLLQYDASKYIFLTLTSLCFVLSYRYYIAIIIQVITIIFLFKQSKNLVIYTFVLILIIAVRINVIESRETEFPIQGRIIEVKEDYILIKDHGLIKAYMDDTSAMVPGYHVIMDGYIMDDVSYQTPNTFDYKTYLLSQNIKQVVGCNEIRVLEYSQNIYTLKYKIEAYITLTYQKETASYLKLFILGEKDTYYERNQSSIQSLGVAHLFAISGMHLGLLVAVISWILKKFYLTKEHNQLIIIILLILYNIITGFKISILRATLLIIGIYFKDYLKILLTSTDLLSISFIGFLVYNPFLVYSSGFQLSYLIAYALVLGDNLYKKDHYTARIIKVSLLANLVSLPIIINMNRSIGLVFLLSNLIFIIFVTYIFLPVSIVLIILPLIENIYLSIIQIFEYLLKTLDSLNIDIHFSFNQSLYIVLYWVFLYLFIILKDKKKQLISLMLLLVISLNIFIPFKSTTFVRFLDVSQGDSIHIHDATCDLLIDTGDDDNYDTLVDYFKSYNIKTIDQIVITHFHQDHYGELNELLNTFHVNNLYLNKEVNTDYEYTILNEGDSFSCGNSNFQVISANTNSVNLNNNSIVLYGVIKNDRYLFTGDIESEIEGEITSKYDFDVDILKVPHHGSNTSSTEQFITMLNPKISVIQVGINNQHNLPNETVLNRYRDLNSIIYRMDQDGTVTIYYYDLINIRLIECYKHNIRPKYSFDFM